MTQKDHNSDEIDKLKAAHAEEKRRLMRIISTYGTIAESFEEYEKPVRQIKVLMESDTGISGDALEAEIQKLRKQIFENEVAGKYPAEPDACRMEIERLLQRITDIHRLIRRVVYYFLEDFYPLEGELKTTADRIHIDVDPEFSVQQMARQVEMFFDFSGALKQKISFDFLSINETFQYLLKQVYLLESVIQGAFDARKKTGDLAVFEADIGREMGAITRAFEVKKNIDELKAVVVNKLGKIRKIVDRKKKSELEQLRSANATIAKLQKKVASVEAEAREVSARASRFQREALFDALTDVHNRKSFELKLQHALTLLEGDSPRQLCLILFDVNYFKWINDTFGHVAGDRVLKVIAGQLKKHFRKTDFVARYGGDEFVVLVEGLDEKRVQERINSYKEQLKTIKFVSHARKTNIQVKISAGLAMARQGDSPNDLLHRADQAMYADKQNASPPPPGHTEASARH